MGDVVAEARAASRADAWRHIEPLAAEVERLRSVVAGVEALAQEDNDDIEDDIEAALERSHGASQCLRMHGCGKAPPSFRSLRHPTGGSTVSDASTSAKNVYKRFIEELDALRINASDPAVHVVGELTRAVKRAQMVVDGELKPLSESDGGSRLTSPFDIRSIERVDD